MLVYIVLGSFWRYGYREGIKRKNELQKSSTTIITTSIVKVVIQNTEIDILKHFYDNYKLV